MSQITTLPIQKPEPACTCRHRWCPRRIHAFLGLFLSLFVVAHLSVALTGLWPERYQSLVAGIHRLGPALPPIELLVIFIPLLVQTVYGLKMLAKIGMAYHTDKKSRGGDLRFFLQRGSAIILLAFIGFHVVTMHRWDFHVLSRSIGAETVAGGQMTGLFRPAQAFQSTAGAIRSYGTSEDAGYRGNLLVIGFYALGIWAVCYHVANGLATGAMAWGITVTEPAQRRCTFLCFGVWVALTLAGTAAWCAFVFGSQPG